MKLELWGHPATGRVELRVPGTGVELVGYGLVGYVEVAVHDAGGDELTAEQIEERMVAHLRRPPA